MATFNNLALTEKGKQAILAAQAGGTLTLSKIGMGSGIAASAAGLTALVEPKVMCSINEKKVSSVGNEDGSTTNYMMVKARMTNEGITEGFYWKETGLFFEDADGNDVLFAYSAVSGDQYDYVPAYADERYVNHLVISDIVTDAADITIKENVGLIYVDTYTLEEYKEEVRQEFDATNANVEIALDSIQVTHANLITDSCKGGLKVNKIFGKSEQDSTTGANLWPYGDITGVAGSNVFNGSELILPAGTYTFKCDISANDGSSFTIAFYDSTGVSILGMNVMNNDVYDGASYTFTLNSDCATFVMYTRSNVTYSNPMLNAGDTALPWEPYTGGKASPNPDYPQEVESAAKDGSLEIGVYGGNLFDSSFRNSSGSIHSVRGTATEADGVFSVTSTEADCYVWTVTPVGKNYIADYSGPIMFIPDHITDITMTLSNGVVKANFITFYDKDLVSLGYVSSNSKSSFTVPVPEGARCFSVRFGYNNESQIGVTNSTTVMVNFGAEALPWEPYTEQSASIAVTGGLPAIPVDSGGLWTDENGQQWVGDYIDVERGVRVHNVGVIDFNGLVCVMNEMPIDSGIYRFEFRYADNPNIAPSAIAYGTTGYCTALSYRFNPLGYNDVDNAIAVYNNGGFYARCDQFETADDFLAHMQSIDAKVYYILAEPYETALSPNELAALCRLKSNEPATTVICEADIEYEYGRTDAAAQALDAYGEALSSGINSIPLRNNYGNVDFGNDLDNWTRTGMYNTTSETTNVPVGDGWGTVFVVSGILDSERTMQIYYAWNFEKGKVFSRARDWDGSWTPWRAFSTQAITYGTDRIVISENEDLNNYLEVGCYKCTQNDIAATLSNCPVTTAFTMDILPGTGSHSKIDDLTQWQYLIQRITTMGGGEYYRTINSDATTGAISYGTWRYVLNNTHIVNNFETTEEGFAADAITVAVLNTKLSNHFEISEATLSSCTLATAIGLLLANASEKGTYSGRFKCSSGWFTFHCYYANDGGYNSGYVCSISDGTAYTFYCKAGADAVLKKLGSPEIKTKTVTSLTGSFDAGGTVLFAAVTSLSCKTNTYATKYGHSAMVNGSVSYSGNTISWGINQSGDDCSGDLTLYSMTIAYAIE